MTEQNPGRVRASDAEREQVVTVLREAIGEGRLTLDEGEQRIAATYAATYRDELPEFTADLPPAESPRPENGPSWRQPPRGRPDPSGAARAGHRRSGPPVGLFALLAIGAGIWALAGSGPLWLAIVLGVLAIMFAKGGGCRRHYGHRHSDHQT